MAAPDTLTRDEYERELDTTLDGSFPASDPPSWTLGASSWMNIRDTVIAAPVPAAMKVASRDVTRDGSMEGTLLADHQEPT
jgi:hypothetical protein